eukprot:8243050-Alexandrium_andersonii.AAC.1
MTCHGWRASRYQTVRKCLRCSTLELRGGMMQPQHWTPEIPRGGRSRRRLSGGSGGRSPPGKDRSPRCYIKKQD